MWLDGLLRGLAAGTDWRFVLCLPRRVANLGIGDLGKRVSILAPPARLPGTLWLQTLAGPSLTGRADVFVGSLGVRPRRLPIPDVLMVHDVTPRTRPQAHTFANRLCFNAYLEESLTSAGTVVCLSEATRKAVARIQPGVARRARVIGAGVDPFFSPAGEGEDGGETRRRFAGGRPYFVQLGTLEPRKGIATLLAAHALLLEHRPDAPDLVLAGGRGWGGRWLASALGRHPEPGRVHLPGYVNRDDARALLRHADLVALVSEEEGFGLPLAEALACGAACVASDAPALVEVAAGAARHVARGDAAALAAALDAALDADAQRSLRAAALSRSAELTWAPPLAAWKALLEDAAREQTAAVRLRMPGDAPARH